LEGFLFPRRLILQITNIAVHYFLQSDNTLIGEKDPDIVKKTNKLKEELKQAQIQLIDIAVELTHDMTEEQLNNYFNSPWANKKYRVKPK
jgi:hypothetical protein